MFNYDSLETSGELNCLIANKLLGANLLQDTDKSYLLDLVKICINLV
jgi:hypothetical protein